MQPGFTRMPLLCTTSSFELFSGALWPLRALWLTLTSREAREGTDWQEACQKRPCLKDPFQFPAQALGKGGEGAQSCKANQPRSSLNFDNNRKYRLSLRQLALLFSKVKHEGLYAAWIYQDAPSMHNKFL